MKYVVRTFLGLTLMIGSVICAAYAIDQFLQIGTCASGGPYVSARECPSGIEKDFALLFGGITLSLVGLGVYAVRGTPPGGAGKRRVRGGVLLWCVIFLGIGAASLWGVWGPDADPGPGGQLGGAIVGITFVVMGLCALPALFSSGEGSISTGLKFASTIGSRLSTGSFGGPAKGDDVERVERLTKLYSQGAISKAEFDELKDKVIEDRDA